MARFALIKNGQVVNVVEQAAAPPGGKWVDVSATPVSPGLTYDGSIFAPVRVVYKRILSGAFWDRFSNGELVDYDVAMQHDPAASSGAKKDAARLRVFRREIGETGYCDLTRSRVRSFVQGLETAGILAAGRALEILDTPITEDEKA